MSGSHNLVGGVCKTVEGCRGYTAVREIVAPDDLDNTSCYILENWHCSVGQIVVLNKK